MSKIPTSTPQAQSSTRSDTLTAAQVRHIIESNQDLPSNRQRVAHLSERTGIAESTFYKFMASGMPDTTPRLLKRTMLQLAAETGATGTDESISGVFL